MRADVLPILWCLVLSPGLARQQPETVEKYLAAARQAGGAGNLVEAEKLYLAAVEQAKQSDDPQLAIALNNLAVNYIRRGQSTKAIECMKQALAVDENTVGPAHPRVAVDLNALAMTYRVSHQAEAEKCFIRALEILESLPEPEASRRFGIINNLNQFYLRQHRYRDSEALLQSAIQAVENSPQVRGMLLTNLKYQLASTYRKEDRESDAEALEGQTEEAVQANQNPDLDPVNLALVEAENYLRSGQVEAAEARYRDAIAALERAPTDETRGLDNPLLLANALEALGELYAADGRDAEAETLFKRAIEQDEHYASPSEVGIGVARSFPLCTACTGLLNLYRTQGRLSEMEPFFERWLAVQEKVLSPEDAAVGRSLVELARVYREETKRGDALPLYQRALKIQEKNEGENPQLAAMLDDYASLLHDLNEEDQAGAVRSRANQIRNRIKAENQKPYGHVR